MVATAALTAVWCVGFATVNVVFEITDHFALGRAPGTVGLRVMDWLVVGLKLIGAALALLSISRRSMVPPALLSPALWAAFGTLGLYEAGNLVEGLAMVLGLMPGGSELRLIDVGYVVFFGLAAVGFGILAVGYFRRLDRPRWPDLLGLAGGPLLIAVVLGVIPAILTAGGLLSLDGLR
ncbi:hypothetical protein SAMN04489812_0555 [Microlunatus soli]|uniref:Uncharacterized protein n=1 Tax=Microlunatus soli TaxID=630515 RepID=A0A1H1NL45_9ACTN|nr:hypothetical protein SAMN04489812_0555 [Microlunatus soli]